MFDAVSSEQGSQAGVATRGGMERRTVLKGAAWSVPVIAAAVAAPSASASLNNANLVWSASSTSLLPLRVLSSQTVLTAGALVTVPTVLSIVNGAGALSGEAVVTISVARPTGLNITVGRAHGFGVDTFNSVAATPSQRTATYVNNLGFPSTTFTTTQTVSVASGATLNLPVVWGLAGSRAGLSIDVAASFAVTATVTIGGKTFTAPSTISALAGAGIF